MASCPGSGTHTAVSSPARCSRARLDASRRSVLTRSPTRFRISDGATTTQACPRAAGVTGCAITAGSRLIAEPQPHPFAAELARQAIQGRRRVGDPTVFADLAADAALGYRHDDPLLVNVNPDISDTIPHDPSPMHEARHRPIRCNPRYLHTVRRVAPPLGGHVV